MLLILKHSVLDQEVQLIQDLEMRAIQMELTMMDNIIMMVVRILLMVRLIIHHHPSQNHSLL